MSKPTILTVDDDPQVSAAITRDLLRGTAATTGSSGPPRGARRSTVLARLALRDEPVALIVADQRMPRDDRHRAAGAARTHAPGRQAPAAHGVRRHRRGHHRDQRDRPRLLPAQAVGPAGGAALPGRRRPARRLAPGQPEQTSRCGSSATAGPSAATSSRRSWPATTCPTAGSTWSATPRAPAGRARRGRPGRPAAGAGARTARPCARPPTSTWPARSACTPAPSSRSTTCASSAAVRPGWPPRSTPPPRGCGTVVVEREAPGGQAGQSAAIENYLGFPRGLSGADLAQRALAQVNRFGAEMVLAREVVGLERAGRSARCCSTAPARSRPAR